LLSVDGLIVWWSIATTSSPGRPMQKLNDTRPADGPLLVELERGLVRTDLLIENLLRLLRRKPVLLLLLPLWLWRGRAALQREVALRQPIEAAELPYDPVVRRRLEAERAGGRRIVLVAAVDRLYAEAIADHLGLFEAVHASDGASCSTGSMAVTAWWRSTPCRHWALSQPDRTARPPGIAPISRRCVLTNG
jgi:hypothetical protein